MDIARSTNRAATAAPLLLLCLTLAATAARPAVAQDNIWQALQSLPGLTNFTRLIQGVPSLYNLTQDDNGSQTFFAPTDEAFARFFNRTRTSLPYLLTCKTELTKLLKYHVTLEGLMVSIATSNEPLVTHWATLLPHADITLSVPEVGGSPITVNLFTANATVVNPDFPAGNAYLQVIDAVLVPKNWRVPPHHSPKPSRPRRHSPKPDSPRPSPHPSPKPSPRGGSPRAARATRRLVTV